MGRAGITGLSRAVRATAWVAVGVALLAGCGRAEPAPHPRDRETAATSRPPAGDRVPFKLTAGRGDFLFEWADGTGEFKTATKLADVPEAFRKQVRVEPLSLPPDRRAPPDQVYLADLRRPDAEGVYPVTLMPREEFEALGQVLWAPLPPARPGEPAAPPPAGGGQAPAPAAPGSVAAGAARVIIYGASWCGACHQAATWLRGRNVAFVEKDIERDPAARAEMIEKCRAAGITPGSIPVIDVGGRMVQGFSPASLQRLL